MGSPPRAGWLLWPRDAACLDRVPRPPSRPLASVCEGRCWLQAVLASLAQGHTCNHRDANKTWSSGLGLLREGRRAAQRTPRVSELDAPREGPPFPACPVTFCCPQPCPSQPIWPRGDRRGPDGSPRVPFSVRGTGGRSGWSLGPWLCSGPASLLLQAHLGLALTCSSIHDSLRQLDLMDAHVF